ncbi:MAG: uracil-DNA glycosylase [Geminicoccaceae bacterium]|nr:uracil-DNA glycosylase [Geminicoccaceae bacterium]
MTDREPALGAAAAAWFGWYAQMGVDCSLQDGPTAAFGDRFDAVSVRAGDEPARGGSRIGGSRVAAAFAGGSADTSGAAAATIAGGAVARARAVAAGCDGLEALRAALAAFDGCALRRTASHCCFDDGDPAARLMLVGDVPDDDEDEQGRPFAGRAGSLLDRMLAAIGLRRAEVWASDAVFWRPPGKRPVTPHERAVCRPFLERQIELVDPAVLLFLGRGGAATLLDLERGEARLRGRRSWYDRPADGRRIPALVTFHPTHLLRSPSNKRLAWRDLLTLADMLAEVEAVARGSSRERSGHDEAGRHAVH